MSLHHLGLHRQFSSPATRTFSDTSLSENLTQDSRDVLVERLNDLVVRLSKTNCLNDSTITSIHSEVDKIELVIHETERSQKLKPFLNEIQEDDTINPKENDPFWAPPTPAQNIKLSLPNSPKRVKARPFPFHAKTTELAPSRVDEIAQAAEGLVSNLSAAINELQFRREESDHVHDLLIGAVEKASERILFLEYRIEEMEDDFQANQSELNFLRIQLQAIEVQCSDYISRSQDLELNESISNWKIDWRDIERKSKARRNKFHLTINNSDGGSNISDTV